MTRKVVYLPENKVYDFGYISNTGKAIIYEEGELNMQDAYAVKLSDIKDIDSTNSTNNRGNYDQ